MKQRTQNKQEKRRSKPHIIANTKETNNNHLYMKQSQAKKKPNNDRLTQLKNKKGKEKRRYKPHATAKPIETNSNHSYNKQTRTSKTPIPQQDKNMWT